MDAKTQAEFRKLIEEETIKMEQKVLEYKELTKPIEPDVAIGRVSRMDAIQNKSINEAALHEAQNKLTALKNIIQKVGDPDFGICAKCGDAIPHRRMILMPQSRMCVACAR